MSAIRHPGYCCPIRADTRRRLRSIRRASAVNAERVARSREDGGEGDAATPSTQARHFQTRSSTRFTCIAVHALLRAVGIPRWLRPAAICRRDDAPDACTSEMTRAFSV